MASPSFKEDWTNCSVFDFIASRSSPSFTFFNSSKSDSIFFLSSLDILSPCSFTFFSVWWINPSAWFLASINSLFFLSASAFSSASLIIFSISLSDNPPEAWMRICCSLPVALSLAETLTIPFASISKVTSIWGIPLAAGGIPTRSNWPNNLLSDAISLSPWKTLIVTALWLSSAVEKIWLFFVGIVVFLSIKRVKTPPNVSIPKERGVTSRSKTSFTSPWRTPPCIAAPVATTSSGLTLLLGSLPKKFLTTSMTFGIRVIPPTSKTSFISDAFKPASLRAVSHGLMVLFIKSPIIASNLALESFIVKCFGPDWSAVINGRFISVSVLLDNSIFAFSAASFKRCRANLSCLKSIALSFLNSSAK